MNRKAEIIRQWVRDNATTLASVRMGQRTTIALLLVNGKRAVMLDHGLSDIEFFIPLTDGPSHAQLEALNQYADFLLGSKEV